MIEKDTIKLLRECDAGIKMGVQSIEDSLKYTSNGELKRTLEKNLAGHVEIQEKLQGLLNSYHDSGKEPPAMAKGMAWLKTNFKLAAESSDDAVADFITDGCNPCLVISTIISRQTRSPRTLPRSLYVLRNAFL